METDRFLATLPRESSLLRRSPWYILAALLLLVSALTRQPIVFFAAGFALVLGALPELWYRFALRSVAVSHRFDQTRVCFGEQVTLSFGIENRKWLPLPWLEVEDEIPAVAELLNGDVSPTYKPERNALVNACSLWAFQRVTRHYHLRCLQRGCYVFGPTMIRSTDPFGWLMHEERLATRTTLLVYPLLAPLSSFGLPARFLFGERPTSQRLLEDPLRVAGVRAYRWGDEPRRINWKASARTGMLQSKLYEPRTQHRLMLFLDSRTFLEAWLGIDPWLAVVGNAVGSAESTRPSPRAASPDGFVPVQFAWFVRPRCRESAGGGCGSVTGCADSCCLNASLYGRAVRATTAHSPGSILSPAAAAAPAAPRGEQTTR